MSNTLNKYNIRTPREAGYFVYKNKRSALIFCSHYVLLYMAV